MIVTVYENDCSKTVVSDKNRFTITVFGCELCVLRIGSRHELRLPKTVTLIKKTMHAFRNEYVLEQADVTARVDFYEDVSGFDEYRCCACEDVLTIGGGIEDDIYIQDHGIPPHAITISLKEHSIISKCEELYCNERLILKGTIDETAVYSILQLRFALCRGMVIFNGPQGIYCVNEPAKRHMNPVEKKKPVRFVSALHQPLPELAIQVKIPEYNVMEPGIDDSILLSSMPSVLMAIGAILSVILMWKDENTSAIDYFARLLMPLVMLMSAVFFMPLQRILRKRKTLKAETAKRKQYEDKLAELKEAIVIRKENVITQLEEMYVMPEVLLTHLNEGKLSCFNIYDSQFLSLRLGISPVPFAITNGPEMVDIDNSCKMLENAVMQKNEGPFVLSLQKGMCYLFVSQNHNIYDEILAKICLTHRPEDVSFIFLEEKEMPIYCMMLPHAHYEGRTMIMEAGEYNKACMHIHAAHILIAFHTLPEDLCTDFAPVFVFSKTMLEDQRIMVFCDLDAGIFENRKDHQYCHFLKDTMSMKLEDIALRLCCDNVHAESDASPSYLSLYHMRDISDLHVEEYWQYSHESVVLQSVCGTDQENNSIVIDLDEKKDGPHGLVAGMTGSGKSEFLISVLLDIAVHNSPQDVSFLIFDFKGGGMLQAFSDEGKLLPHIAGTLTNLDGYEMERVLYALRQTCRDRQKLFSDMHELTAKNISHIDDYRSAWKEAMNLPILSHLLIVVDEFAQLKKEQPQFMDELISIARIGRSLGIHLLLATQKPAGIISDQIRANMSFTVCLRVKDAQDAMEVINDRRPASLVKPGEFYLSSGNAIRYGKAVYLGTKNKADTITCYDSKHHILFSSSSLEKEETDREVLVKKIMETAESYGIQALPVYHKLQETIDPILLRDARAFGMVDDYRNGELVYIRREPVLGIWGTDRVEKEKCKRSILFTLFDQSDLNEEVYLIDEEDKKYDSFCNTAGYIDSSQKERLQALHERIRKNQTHITIVIMDAETFINGGEGNEALLHQWLKASGDNLHLILFLRVSNDLRYRDMASVGQRAVLKGTGIQEAAAILETSVHASMLNRGVMMKWKEYAAELVLPYVTKEMEDELLKRKAGVKRFALWTIPDNIPYERSSAGILLGIDKSNGKKIYVANMPIVLTESEGAKDILEDIYHIPVSMQQGLMISENEPVLYAGYCSSFSLPYELHQKEDIREGEGLYVYGQRRIHVKLCNKRG